MIRRISITGLDRIAPRFERLYGAEAAPDCLERLAMLVGRYGVGFYGQPSGLRWDEKACVLITYGDSIVNPAEAPLVTLQRFLHQRLRGAVSIVHILPFFPYSSDDGFSIIDYREVREDLGTWSDIEAIGKDFDLMFDLVLNHCSRKSGWYEDFVTGVAPARHYFLDVDPKMDLSQVTRPRSSPLLTRSTTATGEHWLWTTFSDDQLDLNFANPDVLFEFLDILFYYIAMGARVVRLDAIAYLWKRIGTSCIHLPETHEVVKLLRDVLDMVAPSVRLLTETNVPHAENVSYFGAGDEAHLVYQFALAPLLLLTLVTGDAGYLTSWLAGLAPPPPGCTYLNFTASHDGIGVRPLEGLVDEATLAGLIDHVQTCGGEVSWRRNADGTDSPYELNISYFDAMGPESPAALRRKRFLLSQTVPLALQGIPAVYLHSLTATPNDHAAVARTGRARSINRGQWQEAELTSCLRDTKSDTGRMFAELTRRLLLRAQTRAFHPEAPQTILQLGPDLLGVSRTAPDGEETVIAIGNVTPRRVSVPPGALVPGASDPVRAVDILAGNKAVDLAAPVILSPYKTVWLKLDQTAQPNRRGKPDPTAQATMR